MARFFCSLRTHHVGRALPPPPPLLRFPSSVALLMLGAALACCHVAGGVEGLEPLIQLHRRWEVDHGVDAGLGSCGLRPERIVGADHIGAVVGGDDGDDGGGGLWPERILTVHQFGAVGDGVHNDTEAFLHAWQTACSSPSQTLLKVPARKIYLVGQIDFGGPCSSNLTLLILGTIVAPSDPDIWHELNSYKWLYFHGINNLIVRGGGTINGMGERWWARSCKIKKTNPCRHAPTAIAFHRCQNLRVHNLMLVNSQQMHIAFTDCTRVRASSLKVIAPAASPNTDGIHISASVHVEIKDSEIRTGDDCISIVSNSSKVQIKNIKCGPGHGISIGSLGKSNSSSSVSYVHVDRVTFSNTENGFRIKTWQGGKGFAHKMSFQNTVMMNVSNPIIIDQYYCDSFLPCPNQTSAVKLNEISFDSIKGTSATENAITFNCSDSHPCEKILLKDIRLSLYSGGHAEAYCWKAYGSSSGFVNPPSCLQGNGGFSSNGKFHSTGSPWSISKWIAILFNPQNWVVPL